MFGLKKIKEAQERAQQVKAHLAVSEFTGESLNGLARAKCTGTKLLVSVEINDSAFKVRPKEDIEAMVIEAVNEAFKFAEIEAESKMREVLPNIPGL